uniref:Proenkephalin b n=1 Tax=Sinocyclocheilus anshuiensis TaxID=1608454 RepID=A0A671P441_9TELE
MLHISPCLYLVNVSVSFYMFPGSSVLCTFVIFTTLKNIQLDHALFMFLSSPNVVTFKNVCLCVGECREHLNAGSSWSLCKSFIQNADNTPEGNRASTATEHLNTQQHPVDKIYGGFIKAVWEFYEALWRIHEENCRAIWAGARGRWTRLRLMAGGRALTDIHDSKGGAQGVKGMAKRYGGFMKRGQFYDLDNEVKALQKRYGGFMRCVGRPQWWQESKRYGGFLKRSQKEDEDEN